MRLLTIKHTDFTIHVENSRFDYIFGKAKRNIGEVGLKTFYHWTDGVESVFYREDGERADIIQNEPAPAVFFDNADYAVWVEFKENKKPDLVKVKTALKSVEDNFVYHKDRGIFSGFLNYGNDIGKSDFSLSYEIGGEKKLFQCFFEVLSTKLDYREHWPKIVGDVEAEYRMLSIDFLKKTYHGFSKDFNHETLDIIWWNLFRDLQKEFIGASRLILSKPRHRVQSQVQYLREDNLKHLTPQLENELTEHRGFESRLYRSETSCVSHDTPENRFFKYALQFITKKHDALAERVTAMDEVSDYHKREISEMQRVLRSLCSNPFFRTVGKFTALSQGSLVFQRAMGYSVIYRVWAILKASHSLNDGMHSLETKDIATLYEIWCFIEVKNIVRELLGSDMKMINEHRPDLSRRFTYNLEKGNQSRILFKKDGVELVELFYNQKTESDNETVKLKDVVSKTVPQKPDIVLQLIKKFSESSITLTYLFDAKYRIDRRIEEVDFPPDDAINQMHRYRDAIYYKDPLGLKKEVIGGYILFPGTGEKLAIQNANFFKSIEEVNVGAFPLRPKDEENRELLKGFVDKLINSESKEHLSMIIPQKGTKVRVENISDAEVFLRDRPVKGLQAWAIENNVYPCHENKLRSDPRFIEWIPLSLSDSPIRLLKVKRYIEKLSLEDFKTKYPSWDESRDLDKDLEPGMYHLWEIEEI